jgi:hypothetical protein
MEAVMKPQDIDTRGVKRATRGSALVAAAVVSAVLSVSAAGYLTFLTHEYYLNYRSLHWTQALHLAEAGVEDALHELNFRYINNTPLTQLSFLPANGWVSLGMGSTYYKTASLTHGVNGSVTAGAFDVEITDPAGTFPLLPPWPDTFRIVATGTVTNHPHGPPVARRLKVICSERARFANAIFSDDTIDMNGNNIRTDSYDSDGGPYPSGAGTLGSVATNSTLIDVGNADIYGSAWTGPGGEVEIGKNGTVSGEIRDDMQIDLPPAQLPADFAPTIGADITNSTTLNAGSDYQVPSINLTGGTLTFQGAGTVRLYVTGNSKVAGTGAIRIASTLTHVEIYLGGPSANFAGNGIINDAASPPINFQIYGLPTLTSLAMSGNSQMSVVVYAPNAAASFSGGGSDSLDVSGSIVVGSLTINGHFAVHYDVSLLDSGEIIGYRAASWEEIPIGP